MDSERSKLEIWLLAARPKTLPAAVAPVIVGSAVAYYERVFALLPALAAFIAALLLQIGANLANDVFDFNRGTDTAERLGPLRVTQAGLLKPRQVLIGTWVCFGVAALLGVYLIFAAGWPVLLIGLASILAAVAYTGGPFPLGYYGLGDLTVFIFFGPVAVCGTVYVQAQSVSPLAIWASLPMGFLITAILVVNNLRDIETDSEAGKRTLAVRIGETATRWEYMLLLIGAFVVPVVLVFGGYGPNWIMFSLGSVPMAYALARFVWVESGRQLNKALAGTGQLTLLYGLFFGLGLVVARFL